jgi:hypothetical protein
VKIKVRSTKTITFAFGRETAAAEAVAQSSAARGHPDDKSRYERKIATSASETAAARKPEEPDNR